MKSEAILKSVSCRLKVYSTQAMSPVLQGTVKTLRFCILQAYGRSFPSLPQEPARLLLWNVGYFQMHPRRINREILERRYLTQRLRSNAKTYVGCSPNFSNHCKLPIVLYVLKYRRLCSIGKFRADRIWKIHTTKTFSPYCKPFRRTENFLTPFRNDWNLLYITPNQ